MSDSNQASVFLQGDQMHDLAILKWWDRSGCPRPSYGKASVARPADHREWL